jgi:very-short-patch-repair endonuclease
MRGPRPYRTRRARALRANATSAEDMLWGELRARRLGGFKFVRQAPVEHYIVDFLCRDHRVVVEVDGATHGEPDEITADYTRTCALERMGYRVYRAWNGDIFDNIDGVLDELLALLEGRLKWRDLRE